MKKIMISSAIFPGLLLTICSNCSVPSSARDVVVYHVGFEIDTITGYHEENFPMAGCKGKMNEDLFKSLLSNAPKNVVFDKKDVKDYGDSGITVTVHLIDMRPEP